MSSAAASLTSATRADRDNVAAMMGKLGRHAVISLGQSACALMAWRHRGVLRITVIAKATFAVAYDTTAARTKPQEIVRDEVHHRKNPSRSVRRTTDLVPYLERADVVFTGSAYAPSGAGVERMEVRLGVFDGRTALLDKALLIQKRGGFKEIPIDYEHAYGGIGCFDNPFGVGAEASPGEPSVLHPQHPHRPAGYGPLSRAWPMRKRMLGDARPALSGSSLTLSDDVPWAYFQSAPPDQQIRHLRGDEWIVMDGLHPSLRRVSTRLPGARGLARVHGLSRFGIAEGSPLALAADTLRIDGDDQLVTITFRAAFPVADESALASVRVAAGVEVPGEPLHWPDPEHVASPHAEESEEGAHEEDSPRSTLTLDDADIVSTRSVGTGTLVEAAPTTPSAVMPFRPGPPAPEIARGSGARPRSAPTDTIDIPGDEVPSAPRSPIDAPVPAPASPSFAPPALPAAPARAANEAREVTVGVAEPAPFAVVKMPKQPGAAAPPGATPSLKRGLYGRFGAQR